MASLIVITDDGAEHQVPVQPGLSLMEAVRNAGIEEMPAICGGCLSCATCHIHVESPWFDKLPPMQAMEAELLEFAEDRDATSRLACQLPFEPDWDGLRLRIAKQA